ncbi:HEAT-like repeat-containing protein [Syntrophotalea carbinolica DSM 2380]|uniref:HEAT-like repeat-containing protein n=1 Tax=Syntrophotalea carbinolica (strain DSM 2380 / NBRC 103641 / GraBd1) TaxID=338963 RepID=Q3A5D0_SYNC1|nr:HEAT-like repeat-containing protein [Syntrophotalea carbinolica DSM 2380]
MEHKNSDMNFDTRVLSNFIFELNISLRLVTTYPPNHPLITSSIRKVLDRLRKLLEFREKISLAVARDSLMVEYALLDSQNPVFRKLAKILFDRDIASITFFKSADVEEILRFNETMSCKRDDLREMGGVSRAVEEAGIRNIVVQEINYGNFSTTEEDKIVLPEGKNSKSTESTLWEDFAHGMLEGSLNPTGGFATYANMSDPGVLAEMMNMYEEQPGSREDNYAAAIASFVGELGREGGDIACHTESLDKLNSFVSKLNPAIRRQFLNGVFTCPGLSQGATREILEKFPDDMILEALRDINARSSYIPPVTVSLLQRLSSTSSMENGRKTVSSVAEIEGEEHLAEKMRVIFREDKSDEFVPQTYQKALRSITSMKTVSVPELEEIGDLHKTLQGHAIETQFCKVVLEAMRVPSDKCRPASLEQNFLALLHYFLESGDFSFLTEIYEQLESVDQALFPEVQNIFTDAKFLNAVLDQLDICEKSKRSDIQNLIARIGKPFAEPLLERLAEAKSRSQRHAYMACLLALGGQVRDAAVARLSDSRWFFVRNLITILRELEDSTVLPHIRRIRDHGHPRVRQEIITTFQQFSHVEADRMLLHDLRSSEQDVRLSAIQLAEKSCDMTVFDELLVCFDKGDWETKSATVRTLARIRNDRALPSLMHYVRTNHLLRQSAHNRVKIEVINTFPQYGAENVVPFLEELALSGQDDLANQAKKLLESIRG